MARLYRCDECQSIISSSYASWGVPSNEQWRTREFCGTDCMLLNVAKDQSVSYAKVVRDFPPDPDIWIPLED